MLAASEYFPGRPLRRPANMRLDGLISVATIATIEAERWC